MTSAVEQAGNDHPVGFPPHRDGPVSQSHFSQFWYRTNSIPEPITVISPSMGASTPPPRGVLKLDVYGSSSKEMTHELPHWMDSKRGHTQSATRLEITPEAGPSTPMKCPPRQLIEPPNSLHQFSPPGSSYVALFDKRSKLTWARQEQSPNIPAGANYPVPASSNRGTDQSGLQRDSVQVQKESQKENVMSLKEVNSIMMTTSKGGASPSTGSSPIGQPPSIRALATLAETKSKTTLPDDSILQLQLRHEPCSRSPVTSPEKHCGDRRAHHEVVGGSDSTSHGVKQEALNRTSRVNDGAWNPVRPGSKSSTYEFSYPQQGHESARSMINSLRLFQPRRQATQESQGSLDLHADLSLALQPATESTHHAMWHGGESPSRLLVQKWSEIISPKPDTYLIAHSNQCSGSTNSTPSAPQTPAENLSLFHLMPSSDTVAREQSRTDDEKMGGLNDGTAAIGRKRKQFRKVHKTADYSPGASSAIELNNPAEYADLRDQIKKRVKREVSEVVPSANQSGAQESLEDTDAEPTSFQLWLQTSETASHPKKHDFFPDKPRCADATVPSPSQESPLRKARMCGTGSPSLFNDSRDFSRDGLLYQNGVVSDNAAAGTFDTTAPNKATLHSMSPFPPRQPSAATEMLEETELGLGRPSTLNPSVAECIRSLPQVVKPLGEQGEEATSGDASWQRSKLFAVPAHAPMPIGHPTFSAGEPSLPLSLSCFAEPVRNPPARSPIASTPKPEEEWGKSLALSATPVAPVPPHSSPAGPPLTYQERFVLLQAYLKHCDEVGTSQNAQALRNLSPAARSGVAVELESKAMWLSIEEGLEMKRLNHINVMGWGTKGSQLSQGDEGATPRGRRLPVPGDMRPIPFFSPTLPSRVPSGVLSVATTPSPFS
ncbi:hypothetical protein Mapa_014801 [Marchantia paleacea]|nr:hypothetical protein Mapa_014801 [Marchantia paleacea]